MPRKKLPSQIERNAKSLKDATPAERDVIDQLPDLWDRHDSITAMANELDWSSSHVGSVWRKFFRPVDGDGQAEPQAEGHAEAEPLPHGSNGERGVDPLEHGSVITIPVNEIPDNDREALAFIKGVKAISAN